MRRTVLEHLSDAELRRLRRRWLAPLLVLRLLRIVAWLGAVYLALKVTGALTWLATLLS